MPSSTVEDYLKAIFQLSRKSTDGKRVALGAVSEQLGLTAGTVTTMMKHLQSEDFVSYEPRRGVTLRESGEKAALQVLRRHRLIEAFLVDIMKLDWADVHEEAEILEHAISDKLIQRIDEMLGHPSHDPHGDPIPTATGEMDNATFAALADVESGHYQLMRVSRDDSEYLKWLSSHSLHPGQALQLVSRDHFAGVITLKVADAEPIQIGETAAQALLVKKC